MRKITKLMLASALALGFNGNARADYIQHLSDEYNISIERLQVLRGNLFNDLNLIGVMKGGFNYDLRDSSFAQYMKRRFGNEGNTVYEFLNQGATEEFGVSVDSATGGTFLNRMIVTPDSVRTISLPLNTTGNFMNKLALKIDSASSIFHRMEKDNREINFEIVGGDDYMRVVEGLPENVLRNKNVIPGSTFMTKEEIEGFYQISGIKGALSNAFNSIDGGRTLGEIFSTTFESKLSTNYAINEKGQAVITTSLNQNGDMPITVHSIVESYLLPKFETRLDFNNPEHMQISELEVVVAETSQPAAPAQVDSQTIYIEATTETAPADTGSVAEIPAEPDTAKKVTVPAETVTRVAEAERGLSFVVAGEYSNMSTYPTGVFGVRAGRWMPFFAYGVDRNSLDETVRFEADSQGRHTEFDVNTNGDTRRIVAGLNYVQEFGRKNAAKKLALILGMHAGKEFSNSKGASTSTRYSNELPIEVKAPVFLDGSSSSLVYGPQVGLQYGNIGLFGSYDVDRSIEQFGIKKSTKRIGGGLIINFGGQKDE
ncbi:hypothetical protein HYT56_02915 [Candidatus Woesearchaeota archaeon]|nr:hypothetical protein [Candidatus Woesearchaeota archaeon]